MCGLTGIVVPPGEVVPRGILEAMNRTLTLRGPDGEGFFIDPDGGCGLGHRRLSIIDLTGGAQPLGTADGQIQAVVNGELYNFVELRNELIAHGHHFRTKSDSEVVVHGYRQWGRDVFRRIDGMFAVALWDVSTRRLLLARDRMGKKPLYFALVGPRKDTLIFGSELRALAAHPALDRHIDPIALSAYLTYECFPENLAIYGAAAKLLPAHVLEYDRDAGRITTHEFWRMNFAGAPSVPDFREWSEDKIAGHLRDTIRDAVEARLVSDVPLGVFLSGGIDSSMVTAAMTELVTPSEVKSFSITFDDPSFDEGPYARQVAQHLGTDHHEQRLSPQAMIDILPEVAGFMSEPIGDASIIPTYLLSKFARQTVTVALGGDGGDELFLGYPTFVADKYAQSLDRVLPLGAQRSLGHGLMQAARLLPVSRQNFSLDFKIKRFAQGLGYRRSVRHQAWMGSFLPEEIAGILVPEVARLALAQSPYKLVEELEAEGPGLGVRDADDAAVYQYSRLYLTAGVLVKVDRASMAASLEVRAPLLDTKVVELACALPGKLKLRGGVTKYILKKAARPWLPDEIIDRPKKGFGIPVGEWLRGPLRAMAHDLLAPTRLKRQGIWQTEPIQKMLAQHDAGTADHRKPLWTLLALQLWLDRFGLDAPRVDRAPSPPAPARESSVLLRF